MFLRVDGYSRLQLERFWLLGSANKHFKECTDSCLSSSNFMEILNELKDLIYSQHESSLLIHLLLGLIKVEKFYSASDSTSSLKVTFRILSFYGYFSIFIKSVWRGTMIRLFCRFCCTNSSRLFFSTILSKLENIWSSASLFFFSGLRWMYFKRSSLYLLKN